jgi:protein N-terminal amidase
MDLNPKEYKSPTAYEYPTFLLSNPQDLQIPLILLPMAWLRHPHSPDSTDSGPGEMTLKYWIQRLEPLVWDQQRRWVVICNRTGGEEEAVYAGTSCVLQVGRGKVDVHGLLGREVGCIDLEIDI